MLILLNKLAIRNVKRSMKDYVIYLITVTLAFSFLFALNLVSNAKEVLALSNIMENFKMVMIVVNFIVVLIICFLINYTSKFMFQKRSKEFGTYLILGIKKNQITKLFTLENLLLGVFSFLLSFPIGYFFSMLLSFIMMNIFELPALIKINLSMEAFFLSFLSFLLIYFFVLFFLRKRMKKLKIYDLLYLEKKNETAKIPTKIRHYGFFLSLSLGILAFLLFDNQFKSIGVEPSMTIILISFFFMILSIYGITLTLADFLVKFVLKSKNRKYKKDYLFITRTFSSKIKTMSFTMGTLTFLITLTLIALNLSSLMKGMFEYQIKRNAPYEIIISKKGMDFAEEFQIIKENYSITEQFHYQDYQDTNNNIRNKIQKEEHFGWKEIDNIIKLSDLNQLLLLQQKEPMYLNEFEFSILCSKEIRKELNQMDVNQITLANQITLQKKEIKSDGYYSNLSFGLSYIIVVPDEAVKDLPSNLNHLIINTKEKTNENLASELSFQLAPDICKKTDKGYDICYYLSNLVVRGQKIATNKGMLTICSFVCFYMAFIFISVAGTILAIQSLSDATKYKYRYTVLKKLGVRKENIRKTILKQLLLFFLFPVIYPIIISFFTIFSMNRIFQISLETNTTYFTYFIINLFLFIIIYFIYFLATYFGYKKNIDE